MKKIFYVFLILLICSGHTMFLKLDTYFLNPNTAVTLQLFNGTFEKSENVIDRDRMLDASILSHDIRYQIVESQWTEKDSTTFLTIQTGEAGTYVAGVSTKARSLEMGAKAFNDYLEHEGLFDMLEWRKKNGTLDSTANEKYSKHVKTIFQVGDSRTNDWQTELGYPIEFVPLENPYSLHTGDSIAVKLLVNGKPLANQLVYADFKVTEDHHSHSHTEEAHGHSHEHHTNDGHTHNHEESHSHSHENGEAHEHEHEHEHGKSTKAHSRDDQEIHTHDNEENEESHTHATGQKLRTDADGIVKAHLHSDGIWYFQTINLVHTKEEGLTHESNWTTLTFEVTHSHDSDTHSHEHEKNSATYLFVIASVLLIGVLFFWFNRKNKVDAN